MNEKSNVAVKICISFKGDLADRCYWVRPEGTTIGMFTYGQQQLTYMIGELKEQLIKDLNWKRTTEIEAIEIGPLTFKEETKKGNDSRRKPNVYLIDSEVYCSPSESI